MSEPTIQKKNMRTLVIEKRLSAPGSLFRTYLVNDLLLNKKFAIKRLSKSLMLKIYSVDDIKQRLKLISSLKHPCLSSFTNYFQESMNIVTIHEYHERTLFDELQKGERLTEELAFFGFLQILQAVTYLHSNKIYHGLINLDDVMIGKNGQLLLSGFEWPELFEQKRSQLGKRSTSFYLVKVMFNS